MKSIKGVVITSGLALAMCTLIAATYQQVREEPMTRAQWEYKVIEPTSGKPSEIEKEFNDLGSEGWEIAGWFGVGKPGFDKLIFKRAKRK